MEIYQYSQLNIPATPSTSDTQSSEHFQEFTQDDKKSYRCTYPNCGKIFKFKSEINRHNVIHYDSRPFPCPHEGCGKCFKRADALDTHVRLHTREMPFECDFHDCDKKFTTKAALKYHILKHNDERSYSCSFPGCDKSFYTKGQLRQHERALSYHLSLSAIKVEEEEPTIRTVVAHSKAQKGDFYKEFYAPTPKLVNDIEWEIKNQVVEENPVEKEDQQESFENIIKYILKESNSPTKVKLEYDSFQEEDKSTSYIGQTGEEWPEHLKEPSVFFDENEFKILDFLKEQAHNGY